MFIPVAAFTLLRLLGRGAIRHRGAVDVAAKSVLGTVRSRIRLSGDAEAPILWETSGRVGSGAGGPGLGGLSVATNSSSLTAPAFSFQ